MKRYLIVLGILSLIFTSCSSNTENNTAQAEESTASPAEPTAANDAEKHYSADGTELRIDMSKYNENAKLLTADDIYLLSYECGSVSGSHPPRLLIIEDREQLDCALEQYRLALPADGVTENEPRLHDTAIAEPFNKMTAEYPVSDYSYVIEYDEVSRGGYDLKVGALLVDEENLFFVHTADSRTPKESSIQFDEMGGFCYMAAVPKDMLMNGHYEGWTYPDENGITP